MEQPFEHDVMEDLADDSPLSSAEEAFEDHGDMTKESPQITVQRDMEERWENLVAGMAPNCIAVPLVLGPHGYVTRVINRASNSVHGENANNLDLPARCDNFEPSIPPHFETSLRGIVANTDDANDVNDPNDVND